MSEQIKTYVVYGTVTGKYSYEDDEEMGVVVTLQTLLPNLLSAATCPECGDNTYLYAVITTLNDRHGWSREQIADWLETLDLDLSFPYG